MGPYTAEHHAAEPDTAAIGAEQAAVNHGLSVLARNIDDPED